MIEWLFLMFFGLLIFLLDLIIAGTASTAAFHGEWGLPIPIRILCFVIAWVFTWSMYEMGAGFKLLWSTRPWKFAREV